MFRGLDRAVAMFNVRVVLLDCFLSDPARVSVLVVDSGGGQWTDGKSFGGSRTGPGRGRGRTGRTCGESRERCPELNRPLQMCPAELGTKPHGQYVRSGERASPALPFCPHKSEP